jgi:hypothetical protein
MHRDLLDPVLKLARTIPPEELPRLIGACAEIVATATSRLAIPPAVSEDSSIGVGEAAKRLGVSASYLYHNHKKFTFTRREGGKLLFSSAGIQAYLREKK